jgi:hypothetical protein
MGQWVNTTMKTPEITNANITKYSVAFFRKLQDFSCVVSLTRGGTLSSLKSDDEVWCESPLQKKGFFKSLVSLYVYLKLFCVMN